MRIYLVDGREVSGFFSGLLHVSNVSRAYVKNMFDFFEKNDIVKAMVISTTNNVFHLSTAQDNVGVILSTCPYCRNPLNKKDGRLICQSCNRRIKKKLSTDYDKDISNLIKSM
jgi:exosome complex RNA-binding protein Csl4